MLTGPGGAKRSCEDGGKSLMKRKDHLIPSKKRKSGRERKERGSSDSRPRKSAELKERRRKGEREEERRKSMIKGGCFGNDKD